MILRFTPHDTRVGQRASMVVGSGSLTFQMMKSLTDRLPVMLCPRWLSTLTQLIAVDDVRAYLLRLSREDASSHVLRRGSRK